MKYIKGSTLRRQKLEAIIAALCGQNIAVDEGAVGGGDHDTDGM